MATTGGMIQLSFPALQAAESSLTGQLSALRARLVQLDGALQPLVRSWTGEAQSAYVVQQQRWATAADDLATMLGAIITALRGTITDYLSTERRITDAFGG